MRAGRLATDQGVKAAEAVAEAGVGWSQTWDVELESPVEVVTPQVDPAPANRFPGPHVMVIRTPDEWLTWLYPLASRHEEVIAHLSGYLGYLIVDGYGAYQKLAAPWPGSSSAPSTCSAAAGRWPSSAPAACRPGPPRPARS